MIKSVAVHLIPAAALLLAALSGTYAAGGSSSKWTAVPVRDATILYVRYGEPGAVRIVRGGRLPDSLVIGQRVEGTAATSTQPEYDSTEAWQLVRGILSEELRRWLGARRGQAAAAEGGGAYDRGDRLLDSGQVISVVPTERRAPGPSSQGVLLIPPPGDQVDTSGVAVAELDAGSLDGVAEDAREQSIRIIKQQFMDSGVLQSNLILFETNQSQILPPSEEILGAIGGALRSFPGVRVRVEGHADHRGSAEYNLLLSQQRADAVRQFLIDQVGLGPEQVESVGYGETRPLITGETATRMALNRRVVFRVLNPQVLQITEPGGR